MKLLYNIIPSFSVHRLSVFENVADDWPEM